MVTALAFFSCALAGYLIGSVSFAILISKGIYKKDVRSLGSGNAGMTNMARNFGKKAAVLTLFGDAAKGAAAVMLGRLLFAALSPELDILYGAYVAGITVILGHMFPLYFGFKGGKGIATSAGVILSLSPVVGIILISIFLLFFKVSGMVSLGSVIGIGMYPVVTLVWSLCYSHRLPVYSTLCAVVISGLIVLMHRENIGRIRRGTEYKFKKEETEETPAEPGVKNQ
ncbi:glycerol-3-phosphate 1-O-acyltransferase PlsY [Ruminococcaceae bacterium OttesenSCG-928-I18]|nr:glycerol-3-phosphate 1-O-acyltransferase PlsY [Ruminococcaceae bacterium OttesenSCG-928-I18]